jgi:hypothetical protein
VLRATGTLADLADKALTGAERLLSNAKPALRRARAKAARSRRAGSRIPLPAGAAAGWPVRSTTWPSW